MADFAGTLTKVSHNAPFAGHPGAAVFQIALTAATYVNGNLNLSSIVPNLPGVQAADVKNIVFTVGGTAAYIVNWTPAATPTWSNLGTLKLFTATGTEATGTLTFTIRGLITFLRDTTL